MNTSLLRRLPAALTITALSLAALSACATTPASSASTTDAADTAITVENCGSQVTLDAPAKRIVLVNNDSLPNLEALDAVDRVVAVTSAPQEGLYKDSTYSTLEIGRAHV